jgi:hypothetical protein
MDLRDSGTPIRNLDYLSSHFDEICFKCLTFRTHKSDHCSVKDTCILENHGFSRLFNRTIHLYNFRAYFMCTLCFVIFLTVSIVAIIKW